jgi:hypothetical protein
LVERGQFHCIGSEYVTTGYRHRPDVGLEFALGEWPTEVLLGLPQ